MPILFIPTISAILSLSPPTSKAFYVSTSGSNSHPGTQDKPWRTVAYAVSSASPAPPGSTIYVRAGLYTGENVVCEKDNLRVIGYRHTPGDQPPILCNKETPYVPFDPADMPVLDGGNRASGTGIDLRGRRNILLRNMCATRYAIGVRAGNPSQNFIENHKLENVNVSTVGATDAPYSGHGITLGSMGTLYSNGVTVRDSLIVNAGAEGLTLNGNENVATNVKVYCNDTTTIASATDYYIIVTGNKNIVENSVVTRTPLLPHQGHGFSIKSNAEQVIDRGLQVPIVNPTGNLFRNNVAVNVGEGFVVRHRGVRFNTFRDNRAMGTHTGSGNCGEGNGISIRDGASDNVFINTKIVNVCSAIRFRDTTEDGDTIPNPPGHPGNNNLIDGAEVRNAYYGIDFNDYSIQSDAGANTIMNSRFALTRVLFNVNRHATQMRYLNISFEGTADVTPPPGGSFHRGSFKSDIVPSQFTGCTFTGIEGGVPPAFQ